LADSDHPGLRHSASQDARWLHPGYGSAPLNVPARRVD
jgi:hypothetical protein